MSEEISFRLDAADIGRAIRELRKYKNRIETKTQELNSRVANLLRERINDALASAVSDYFWQKGTDGAVFTEEKPDYNIGITEDGNTRIVWISGQDAVFVEFGTGIYHNGAAGQSPHPKGQELGLTIGTYGKHRGSHKTWGFIRGGDRYLTHGIEAQMPIYKAAEEIAVGIESIAKEVFSNG